MAEWFIQSVRADIEEIAKALNITETVAQIVVNRGIRSYEEARAFLNPELSELPSPFEITDVEKAVQCLVRHIESGNRIAVYGDYDVDGVMSAVILQKCLSRLNADYVYYVPDRELEGYGLNKVSVLELESTGVSLIIACDNGISAIEESELIYEKGMELIVIDHHEPTREEDGKEILPKAEAVINPKRSGCSYPFKAMCAAGLCYRFASALFERLGDKPLDDDELLIFAALATVCDIVDLVGDNRILVKNGLKKVHTTKNPGLCALLSLYDMKKVSAYHFGFILGPAINASGRLESARTAARLFLTEDAEEAAAIAQKLQGLNISRRQMTEEAYERLCGVLDDKKEREQKVYVLYDEQVHESVAGIVAGRLKETFCHPLVVIAKGKDCAKGSARSIPGYNIYEALAEVSHLFIKFGGHSQAAGFSLPHENVAELKRVLNERCQLTAADFVPKLHIDMRLNPKMATFNLCRELTALEPFGKGNREPLFAEKAVQFERVEFIGKERNIVKLWLRNSSITAISFDGCEKFLSIIKKKVGTDDKLKLSAARYFELDIVYSAALSEYRGEYTPQLIIKDFR